jgi:hypothetical protein
MAARNAAAMVDGQAFLAAYGQSREMLFELGKAQSARNYAAFVQSAGISPEVADALAAKTSEYWIEKLAVMPGGVHPGDPNLPDDEVKAILGEQGFQQLQEFRRVQPLQGVVGDVSTLSVGAPLTPTQSAQLLTIFANASSSYQSGGVARPPTVDWDQVMIQAQGVLSPVQLNALKAEAQGPKVMALIAQFYKDREAK